jgi:bacterioferritin-associated ferredoxin
MELLLDILSDKSSNLIKVQEGQTLSERIPELPVFIARVTRLSKVSANVVAVACIYLDRLKAHLPEHARGLPCTRHRVLLAALIVAFKYLNDVGMRNRHWARISGVFDVSEVNLMERQFLHLIDYSLGFTAGELDPLLEHSMRQQQLVQWAAEQQQQQQQRTRKSMPIGADCGSSIQLNSSLLAQHLAQLTAGASAALSDDTASQMTVMSVSTTASVGSLSPPPSLSEAFNNRDGRSDSTASSTVVVAASGVVDMEYNSGSVVSY